MFFTFILSFLLSGPIVTNAQDASSTAPPLKVGYVNLEYIVQSMPEREAVDAELNTFYSQLSKKMQAKVQELQAQHASLQKKEKLTEQDQMTLQQLEQDFKKFDQESQKKLMDKRVSLYQPLYEKAKYAITQIAKTHGYTYILNSRGGAIIYAEEAHDLSSLVFKQLGLSPQKGEG